MTFTTATLVLLSLLVSTWAVNERLKEVFAWKEVDFAYPSPEARQDAIDKKLFIPANNLPLGLDVSGDRLFITVPRWKNGVPSTLNYVKISDSDLAKGKSPALIPYPDWESNVLPDADSDNKSSSIISTFRIRVDSCKRLWVMDTGMADIWGTPTAYSSPKIMVYDLNTDTLIRTYCLCDDVVTPDSLFANIAVDVCRDDCDNAHAYLPDLGGNALVVYSWKNDEAWRITHHYFHFDPLHGNYKIAGIDFQWNDGVFGVSLSPIQEECYRTLYFHPLSSIQEFAVSTKVIQNKDLGKDNYSEFKIVGSRGNDSQSTASFIHEKTGVMFYAQPQKNAVGCWNTNKPFSEETQGIVAEDDDTLVFVNDLKVCNGDNLWLISDKLPVFLYRQLDPEQVNYRVFKAPVTEAIKGTVCE